MMSGRIGLEDELIGRMCWIKGKGAAVWRIDARWFLSKKTDVAYVLSNDGDRKRIVSADDLVLI